MSCHQGGKGSGLCPVSFGLALGIASALCVFLWSVWVMMYGVPAGMPVYHTMPDPTWMGIAYHSLFVLVKGFVFGFVVALIYDLCLCCGAKFCKKSDGSCDGGAAK